MQFKLNSVKPISKPFTKKEGLPPVDKYGINIMITAGIVGQPYNGFTASSNIFYELERGKTIDENDVELNAFATQYVATKYPNT
jgi:hypothetical protein